MPSHLSFLSKFFIFRVLLLSTVYLLLTTALTVPVKARDCNKPSDFPFSNIVSVFLDPDDDCSMDYFNDPSTPVFKKWLSMAEVSCIRDPMLNSQFIGDLEKAMEDGDINDETAESGGQALTGLQSKIPNIGLDAKTVEKDMADSSLSPATEAIVAAHVQFSPGGLVEASMRANGDLTREEYMKKFPECWITNPDGTGFINDFCEIGTHWKSEGEIFNDHLKPQGRDKDVACAEGHAEPQVHCQNSYNVGATTTNVDILKAFLPKNAEEYVALDPTTKNKLSASVQPTKALTMICVALVPNIARTYQFLDNNGGIWKYSLDGTDVEKFGSKETKIACGEVKGLVGTIEGVEEEFRVYNPPSVGGGSKPIARVIQEAWEKAKTTGEDNMEWPPPKCDKYCARDKAIFEKLRKVGSSCRGPQDNYKQFSGGNTDTKTMGDPSWLFSLFNLHPRETAESGGDEVNPYSIYFLSPAEFTALEQLTGLNPYSPYRSYLTPEESRVLDDDKYTVDIANCLTDDSGATPADPAGWWPEEVERIDENGDPYTDIVQKTLRFRYAGGGQRCIHQRGGQQAQNFLELTFQKLKTLFDPERIDECSLYGGLAKKIANLPGILGLAGGAAESFIGVSDDCRPNVQDLATTTPPISTGGACKQWLLENNNYDKVLTAAGNTTCNGQSLNPYWAMTIALNENGALMSNDPEGRSTAHFGCDPFGAAGYDTTIEAKLTCMVNTLQSYCVSGKSDAESLSTYGYPPGYEFGPMQVLMGSDSITPSQYPPLWGGGDSGNLVANLLGADWAAYYSGAIDEFCPGASSIESPGSSSLNEVNL